MSPFGEGLLEAWEERLKADTSDDPATIREWRQDVLGVPSGDPADDFPHVVDLRRRCLARAGDVDPPAGLLKTAGIDVQQDVLHAVLMGWQPSGTGWLLERAPVSTARRRTRMTTAGCRRTSGLAPAGVGWSTLTPGTSRTWSTRSSPIGNNAGCRGAEMIKGWADGPFCPPAYEPEGRIKMVQGGVPGQVIPVRR